MPASLLNAMPELNYEDQSPRTIDLMAKSIKFVLVQLARGDIHIHAAEEVNKVAVDEKGGATFYLRENADLPAIEDEGARVLSTLQLSFPQYVTKRIASVAHDGRPRTIPMRDFEIIKKGMVFYHATVIQSILEEFELTTIEKSALFQVEGRTQREIWGHALKEATRLLSAKLVVPTEFAYKSALLWGHITKLSGDEDVPKALRFVTNDISLSDQSNSSVISINIDELSQLRDTLGCNYVEGRVRCKFIDEIQAEGAKPGRAEFDFMKRFPYPGNLKI